MMRQGQFHAWQRKKYYIAITDMSGEPGSQEVDGIALGDVPLGLHFRVDHVDVTHLTSGKRIGTARTLGAAMDFVHKVMYEADWRAEVPVISATLYALLTEGAT